MLSVKSTRILALYLPYLPTDRTHRARYGGKWRACERADRPPLVHAHKHKNAMRIAHCDEKAARSGLRIGQGLADAKAAHANLDVVPANPEADKALMMAIADWCDRYTPLVAFDGPDGLFMDVTGCLHLFGGEAALMSDLLARLFDQGFCARAAIATNAGTAFAASRAGSHDATFVEPGAEAQILRPFGLSALRLDEALIAGLEKVGLKTIGQIMDVPRAPLTRRFGCLPFMRLDQALGQIDEVLSPRLPVPDFSSERRLAEPVGLIEDIERLVFSLGGQVQSVLAKKGVGARMMELTLFRIDGQVSRLCVGTSHPVRDPETIVKLFRERLKSLGDDFDAGYGFDIVRLNVLSASNFDETQGDFNDGAGPDKSHDIHTLMDRISARLGSNMMMQDQSGRANGSSVCVGRLEPHESHLPERAETYVPVTQRAKSAKPKSVKPNSAPPPHALGVRPVRLFDPPEPVDVVAQVPEGPPVQFRWRRALYRVERFEGPERLAGEWWCEDLVAKGTPAPRDYYRVEDGDGRRFWLFRQGLYGPRGGQEPPRWFMHGLFA